MKEKQSRRRFLKITGGIAAAATFLPLSTFAGIGSVVRDKWGELLPQRTFGGTGKQVTMLGLGGFHVGRMDDAMAQQTIETAIEGGIRFIDTAESYQSGGSEEILGRLAMPKYRDELFVMTKTRATDAKIAQEHLEGSLKRLNCDYLDLWQMHSIDTIEDVENRVKNGVIDYMLKAKADGKVKHIGFTGHMNYDAHLRIMELSDEFEGSMMPINVIDPGYRSYIKNVVPVLNEKKIGVIAMKTVAGGAFFGRGFDGRRDAEQKVMDFVSMEEAMHFVWSLPVDVLVTGPKTPEMLQEKIDLAKSFTQLDEDALEKISQKVIHLAGSGVEYYKA